jgi:pimeloyl-ACP methyl ester carboxylesterase
MLWDGVQPNNGVFCLSMSAPPVLTAHRQRDGDCALVFIHGFSGDPAKTWGQFPSFVAADPRLGDWDIYSFGYTTRLVPDLVGLWSANAPLDRLSLLLEAAASVAPLQRYRSLALVAHSMGGLVLQRALVDHPALVARVSHVVLFGTPSAGLAKASPFRFLKRQLRDMAEGGEFISGLRERWTAVFGPAPPFHFVTVAGDQDEFVPSSSSLEPFPLGQRSVVPGNHLEIVKPTDDNSLSLQLLLSCIIGEAAPAGPRSAARLALESREFARAVQLLEPNKEDLDRQGLVELALALEQSGRQEEAIALLERRAGHETDPMGVLAGRLKRRWLAGRRRMDAERALALYRDAYEISAAKNDHTQAYYHGINVAFMELAYGSDYEAAKIAATEVLDHCSQSGGDRWKTGTIAEANLILGETAAALAHYREAVTQLRSPREIESMLQQALRVADLLGDDDAAARLDALYRGEEAA